MNKQIKTSAVFVLILFLASCGEETLWSPPYVITSPVCEIIERPGNFTYAGIVFKFLNTSGKTIDAVKVSFMLFDAGTKGNPFTGSNIFEITMLGVIYPNENKEITVSLDRYIYKAPSVPFVIDFFYISEIHYTDGSIWQDKYGIYRL